MTSNGGSEVKMALQPCHWKEFHPELGDIRAQHYYDPDIRRDARLYSSKFASNSARSSNGIWHPNLQTPNVKRSANPKLKVDSN